MLLDKHDVNFPYSDSDLSFRADYVGGSDPIYIGRAIPGSLTNEAKWQIQKITYDVNGNPTSGLYAGDENDYDNIWDNRATLSYG